MWRELMKLSYLGAAENWSKLNTSWRASGAILPIANENEFPAASLGFPILICVVTWQLAGAQPSNPTIRENSPALSTEEIVNNLVRRNLERSRALAAYREPERIGWTTAGSLAPGLRRWWSRSATRLLGARGRTKEFTIRSESGSKLLIERVFKKMLQSEKESVAEENQRGVALNRDNYNFSLMGQEKTPAGSVYILSVEPRTQNKLLYRGRIWVDAADFAVMRIEGEPAKNPSFWTKETQIEQVYTKVGDFWLPRSNRSTSTIRLGGHASFTIDYGDYRITASHSVAAAR